MNHLDGVIALIRQRKSWRTFANQPLPPESRQKISAFLQGPLPAPFPGSWRFELTSSRHQGQEGKPIQIGTYGTVTGARDFIVGAIQNDSYALLNYGFLLEQIILFATSLGLGTCWLGATFRQQGFARAIGATDREIVPAVTPVGVKVQTRGMQDHLMNFYATAHTRAPWPKLFFQDDFNRGLTPENAGPYAEPLEMVRLAPSASNRQPWRIVRSGPEPHFYFHLRRNPVYISIIHSVFDAHDLQLIDLGIAMCHFELTAQALSLPGRWVCGLPPDIATPERTEYVVTWIHG